MTKADLPSTNDGATEVVSFPTLMLFARPMPSPGFAGQDPCGSEGCEGSALQSEGCLFLGLPAAGVVAGRDAGATKITSDDGGCWSWHSGTPGMSFLAVRRLTPEGGCGRRCSFR